MFQKYVFHATFFCVWEIYGTFNKMYDLFESNFHCLSYQILIPYLYNIIHTLYYTIIHILIPL